MEIWKCSTQLLNLSLRDERLVSIGIFPINVTVEFEFNLWNGDEPRVTGMIIFSLKFYIPWSRHEKINDFILHDVQVTDGMDSSFMKY